jgi:hypothetical protein
MQGICKNGSVVNDEGLTLLWTEEEKKSLSVHILLVGKRCQCEFNQKHFLGKHYSGYILALQAHHICNPIHKNSH